MRSRAAKWRSLGKALKAPVISDVYKHYRGENLPDQSYVINTVVVEFKVPADRAEAFSEIFKAVLSEAKLLEDVGEKKRVLDVTHSAETKSC